MRNATRTRIRAAVLVVVVFSIVASMTVSVTRRDAGAQTTATFTLWSSSVVPGTPATSDTSAVTVGVKFRSDVAGFVTGVRFYKGAGNSGTHVGDLWSATGTRLASATFSGESATGWQQVNFASPVPVSANTIYIASYLAPVGRYAFDGNYFGSTGVDSGPLHAPANSVTANGVFGRGTSSVFPDQTFAAANYWVDVVFSTQVAPDTTPPTVASTSPTAGASGVAVGVAPRATFSEAVQPASVSFTLNGPGGAVPGTVSYDSASNSSVFTPTSPLAAGGSYTATVSGAQDSAGNTMTAPSTWTFTTQAPVGPGPFTLWSSSVVPGTPATSDTSAVTVGVKFRSDVAGFVTGVRFYKGAGNSGTHVGDLWSATGTRLASATFSGESATGWQQVNFASPVPVSANTIYIASYLAPVGRYAFDGNYFGSTGVDSGPLHAPANSVTANGVFGRGTSSVFPDQTFAAANYWVDVVFSTQVAPDTTPPTVASTSPTAGASGVAVGVAPRATFSEAVQPASVSFTLNGPGGAVPGTVSYDSASNSSVFTPTSPLAAGGSYTATVSGAQDSAGNTMTAPSTWTFTTGGSSLPLDQGPGGPILVVTNSGNRFTSYYAEILRNEGFDEFATQGIGSVTAATLNGYDTVILGEMPLTSAQVSMLSDWVNAGGNLIAMRPSKNLASLLGLTDSSSTLAERYLKVDTSTQVGNGITDQTIQYHGTADRYSLSGANAIANLYTDATTATSSPAVSLRSVGSNGGQAAAFTYDLATSVVETRQGNPAWAGQSRDGQGIIRSDNLFIGANGSPDWVNLDKVQIPQADEQQRLLGNLITRMTLDRKPLPHFWYLPNGKPAAILMTGDDHARGGTNARFQQFAAESTPGCNVGAWECIRGTSYIYPGTPITDAQAQQYIAEGFDIGTHVTISGTDDCQDFTPATAASAFSTQIAQLAAQLPSITLSPTMRIHCVPWSDWSTAPKTEIANGIHLDTDYYYWPDFWIQDRPGMFTGSGMPMRFADNDGTMLDDYQAVSQMTDESGQTYSKNVDTLLDNATGPLGYYGVFTVNAHTDDDESAVADAVIASAQAHGVPVVSAKQMLTWLDGRNSSSFQSITWNGTSLSFGIVPGAGANGLTALLPATASGGQALTALTLNGAPASYQSVTVKGIQYVRFAAGAGSYVATYGTGGGTTDTTPPAITGVSATPTSTSASITWTTDEASNSRVAYGTSATALTQSSTNAALVTSHTVSLTGLQANATYYYRVTSADAANNSATSPASPAAPSSFTTALASITDTTTANFSTGTVGTGAYVSQTDDGEVMAAPAAGSEFGGTTLPSGWTSTNLQSGGSTKVANGSLSVDGAYARTSATFGSKRSLEFSGTFSTDANQSVGLGSDLSAAPWAEFSTRTGGSLWASTRAANGTQTNTQIDPSVFGEEGVFGQRAPVPHRLGRVDDHVLRRRRRRRDAPGRDQHFDATGRP